MTSRGAAKVDYRLLAARGYSVDPHKDEATDRIFVHDFVLPVRIGTYAREHDKPQNVRFNVDVKVLRAGHAPEDMRDVFSYDVITDSIRMIVAQEHIALVEMLAERIAAVVLTHPRVASVDGAGREARRRSRRASASRSCASGRPRSRRCIICFRSPPPRAIRKPQRECAAGDLTVIKLGGSHAFAPHLQDWIEAIADCAGRVVVVPGGGPFADAVRDAQPKMGFDDGAAHHMALLAMEQYGMRAREPGRASLSLADFAAAIDARADAKQVPVWLPTRMVLAAKDIPCVLGRDVRQPCGMARGQARCAPAAAGQAWRRARREPCVARRAGRARHRRSRRFRGFCSGRASRPSCSARAIMRRPRPPCATGQRPARGSTRASCA